MRLKMFLSLIIAIWCAHPLLSQKLTLGVETGINFSNIRGNLYS